MGFKRKPKKEVGYGAGLWKRGNSWRFRYTGLDGKPKAMVLGTADLISEADARMKILGNRKLLADREDPAKHCRLASRVTQTHDVTFWDCAEEYIRERGTRWTEKHREQWYSTIRTFVLPVFKDMPVRAIDRELVKQVLAPIWVSKNETASRLRGRIEQILDWATFHNHREGDNPARWRGNLAFVLEKRSSVRKVTHFTALPLDAMGDFVARLQGQRGIAPRALEFLILTACRTSEVIGIRWSELDLAEKVWTVPAERMKARREHRVPLSDRAVEIIEEMKAISFGDLVFPGGPAAPKLQRLGMPRPDKALSNMAFLELLRRMEVKVTAHGMRSVFRDWCAERTNFPREVAEMALAHVIRDKTEAAYRRGDLFEKRRQLMNAWAKFCSRPSVKAGAVIAINASRVWEVQA